MKHFIIFIYILALTSGMGMISLITIFYFKLRIHYLKYFIYFLWTFFLYIAFNLLRTYLVNIPSQPPAWAHAATLPFHFIFIAMFYVIGVYCIHDMTEKPLKIWEKVYLAAIVLYYSGMIAIPFFSQSEPAMIYQHSYKLLSSYQHLFVFTVLFMTSMFIIYYLYRQLNNTYMKNALKWFLISSAVFTLGSYLTYFLIFNNPAISQAVKQLIDVSLMFTLYYFLFNVSNFFFFLKFIFNKSIQNEKSLLNEFAERFSISQSERNVLSYALQDLSYKDIADRLFVSTRTVETHLYRIYKKTNTKSKTELIELYSRKQKDD